MKHLKRHLWLAIGSLCLAHSANATLMTFDGSASSWDTAYDSSLVNVVFQTNKYNWGTGYNDLVNVAYGDSGQTLVIDFIALAGATVSLNGFDLGNYLSNGAATQYRVYDLANLVTPLISQATSIAYSASSHASYTVGLSSTAGLRLVLGPDIYNNAVDNINFSATAAATVPEPTTLALVGMAMGLLGFSTRRR